MKKILLLLFLLLLTGASLFAASRDPVAVLFQVKGQVEYQKKNSWRKIRHSKFLFEGIRVRTGADGSATITIQESGKNVKINPGSLIEVKDSGLVPIQGTLTALEETGRLEHGLIKRFTKSQSYTTVRRSADKNELELETARKSVLSSAYPYFVWESAGSEYGYQLKVGEETYQVQPSSDDIVRVKIDPFQGSQDIELKVIDNNGAVVTELMPYRFKGDVEKHQLVWLDSSNEQALNNSVKRIKGLYGDNSFMLGSLFEENEMWVAAMDLYASYLKENPDEIEMTPYLFRIYKKLKLEKTYKKELEQWKQAMNNL